MSAWLDEHLAERRAPQWLKRGYWRVRQHSSFVRGDGVTGATRAVVEGAYLVNDLDLEVVAPNGTHYYGNSGLYTTGQCLRAPHWDACNNVEGVLVPNAAYGNYTIIVHGYNVANGPQPFAVVASGDNLLLGDKRVFLPVLRR